MDPELTRMGEAGLIADPVPQPAATGSPAAQVVSEVLLNLHAGAGAN